MKWWTKLPVKMRTAVVAYARTLAGSGMYASENSTWDQLQPGDKAYLCYAYLDLYENILGVSMDLASIPGITLKP